MKSRAARLMARTAAVLVLLGAVPAWMTIEGIPASRLLTGWFWGNVAESLVSLGAAAPSWTMPAAALLGITLAAIIAFLLRRRAGRTAAPEESSTPAEKARRIGVASHLAAQGAPAVAIARRTGFARDAVRSIARGAMGA